MSDTQTVIDGIDGLRELVAKAPLVLGKSEAIYIGQARINDFADATGDNQWPHVDEEKAAAVFGSTIAHGFLTLSLMAKPLMDLLGEYMINIGGGLNYGGNKFRFPSMVPARSEIVFTFTVTEVGDSKPDGSAQVQILTEGHLVGQESGKPALVLEGLYVIMPA